jgi:hypothetical protein
LIKDTTADPAFKHVKFAEAVLDPGEFKVEIRELKPGDIEHKAKIDLLQQAIPVTPLPHMPR